MNALRVIALFVWWIPRAGCVLAWALVRDLIWPEYRSVRGPDGRFTRHAHRPRFRREYARMFGLPLGQLECDVKAWSAGEGYRP